MRASAPVADRQVLAGATLTMKVTFQATSEVQVLFAERCAGESKPSSGFAADRLLHLE